LTLMNRTRSWLSSRTYLSTSRDTKSFWPLLNKEPQFWSQITTFLFKIKTKKRNLLINAFSGKKFLQLSDILTKFSDDFASPTPKLNGLCSNNTANCSAILNNSELVRLSLFRISSREMSHFWKKK
jgi:hypothetical protein